MLDAGGPQSFSAASALDGMAGDSEILWKGSVIAQHSMCQESLWQGMNTSRQEPNCFASQGSNAAVLLSMGAKAIVQSYCLVR